MNNAKKFSISFLIVFVIDIYIYIFFNNFCFILRDFELNINYWRISFLLANRRSEVRQVELARGKFLEYGNGMVCMLWIIPRFATLIAPYSIIQNIWWRSILSPAYLYTVFYRCFVHRESRVTNVWHTYWCIYNTICSTTIRSTTRDGRTLNSTHVNRCIYLFWLF